MLKYLLAASFLTSSYLSSAIYESNSGYVFSYEKITYDDFVLNLSTPEWQPRLYYSGITSSSIGYFYVNNWAGDIGIYGSNRYVLEDNAETFYQSLQPLETNLLPYATPNASSCISSRILSEETTSISKLPAKRVVFELDLPGQKSEIVVAYVFTKAKVGFLSNSILGYTYSISCSKDVYATKKEQIDKIVRGLKVR